MTCGKEKMASIDKQNDRITRRVLCTFFALKVC